MALQEYFGETCPHCVKMAPLVEKLKEEAGIEIEQFEVWNSEENAKKQEKVDKGLCGGVPFFYNTETKDFLCGSVEYEVLLKWAKGEK